MRVLVAMAWLGLVLTLAMPMAAEELPATTSTALTEPHGPESENDPHPALPVEATWAGSMVILVALLFFSAAVIGPAVRANMPAEEPLAPHHDDASHHAADGHH